MSYYFCLFVRSAAIRGYKTNIIPRNCFGSSESFVMLGNCENNIHDNCAKLNRFMLRIFVVEDEVFFSEIHFIYYGLVECANDPAKSFFPLEL